MNKLKQYNLKKNQIISIIFFSIIQIIPLCTPFIMGLIIDDYIPNKNINGLIIGVIIFISIPFISIVMQTMYNYVTMKFIRKNGNKISIDIMTNLVNQNMSEFDKQNSLELLSYSSKEAVSYINFYISDLAKYYVSILITLAIFIILLFVNPILALIQLLYLPIAYFPVKKIMKNVDKEIKEVMSTNAIINQVKGDVFQAIEFIKLNRLEDTKLKEVNHYNNKINKIWGRVAALDSLSGIWNTGFVTILFTGITFGVGALLIFNDYLLIGQLVSVITYVAMLYTYFNYMLRTSVDKKKKEAEYEKIFSYLTLTTEVDENKDKKQFDFKKDIVFKNCNFAYNEEKSILNNLNLTIKNNEWTGIVGQSGSGKTTILDLITKLYTTNDNEVFIDNIDINTINSFDLRTKITKITQDVYLFPGTIEDNLKLINSNDKDIQNALEFAGLTEYVSKLPNGIKTDIGEAGKLMSGGEKQRLSIALGLLRNNKILLLDEVTSNLDSKTEEIICNNFKTLIKEGYTIISISHKEDTHKNADVIYEISNGELKK